MTNSYRMGSPRSGERLRLSGNPETPRTGKRLGNEAITLAATSEGHSAIWKGGSL